MATAAEFQAVLSALDAVPLGTALTKFDLKLMCPPCKTDEVQPTKKITND